MPEPSTREATRSREKINYGETTYAQYKDIQKRVDNIERELDRVNIRLDRVERKMEKLDEKIDETRRELSGKIDRLADKIDSSSNHGQISTITTIGIALGVLYALIFK